MAFLFQHKKSQIPQSDNPYWMSFSDMMSGMLIIFILICIVLIYKLSERDEKLISEIKESKGIRSVILTEIKKNIELELEDVIVEITDNDSVLRIPEDSLNFDTGKFDIKYKYQQRAKKIGEILFNAIKDESRREHLDTIFIEGHTDSRPAPNILKDNWGLSTMRAISLWEFWTDKSKNDYAEELRTLKNGEGKFLFSVSGYADTRRAQEKEITEDDYRKNRRIDIRFTIRQPTVATIEKIEDIIAPLKEK